MKKAKGIIWGIALTAIGVIWGLKVLGILGFSIFFDGWWTFFIIIPCAIGLFTDSEKTGSIIGIAVGLLLLLACRDVFSFSTVWKLILPLVIAVIGLRLLLREILTPKSVKAVKEIDLREDYKSYTAIFSGQELNSDNEVFKGARLTAIFGGIELDLRKAVFQSDTVIEVCCVFGGADIFLPDNVNVKFTSDSVFGGVSNKKPCLVDEGLPTVFVKASCVFGGADIK